MAFHRDKKITRALFSNTISKYRQLLLLNRFSIIFDKQVTYPLLVFQKQYKDSILGKWAPKCFKPEEKPEKSFSPEIED